jgi:hypothetical protein
VADRSISQFAERLSPNDVISPDALRIDSDKIEKLAMRIRECEQHDGIGNAFRPSEDWTRVRRTLDRDVPRLFRTELGKLIVSATRGNVLLHPGFVAEPDLDTIAEGLLATPRPAATPGAGRPQCIQAGLRHL